MRTLKISSDEVKSGHMHADNIQASIKALKEDGVVLLSGVIDVDHIDRLSQKMLEDVDSVEQTNGISNNWQGVRPPPFHPYLFSDIVFNEMVITITHQIMGDGVILDSYGANTAFSGNEQQGVHADTHQLWPNLDYIPPPHCIVINVPLVDVDQSNGATKVWLGTHQDTRIQPNNRHITEEMIAEWDAKRPAEYTFSQRGDLILRDMRVWHCGMPNHTDTPRPMLAMIHRCEWESQWGFEVQKGTEAFFQHPILRTSAVYTDAPIDYLRQGHSKPLAN